MIIPDVTLLFTEKVYSNRTSAFFLFLSIIFAALFLWRFQSTRFDSLSIIFLLFCVLFLFYTINFRRLTIQITSKSLKLKFGIFSWTVPIENIAGCQLDNPPILNKYGGAGIHFMFVNKRYRVSFNFLEHPRLAVALKRKSGPVQDVSFSTRHPDQILQTLQLTSMPPE